MDKTRKAIAAALVWLVVWQFTAMLANRGLLIAMPTPLTTAAALFHLMRQGSFWAIVAASVLRIAMGFGMALVVGALGAFLCTKSRCFDALTAPVLQLLRAVPVASAAVVVFLWVNRSQIPTLIAFMTVLPMVWSQMETGFRQLNSRTLEVAKVFGLSRRLTLTRIILPELRPVLSAAVTTGIGFAWKSGVAAEVICRTQNSLGDLLWVGKSSIEYDEVFAVTAMIVLLSIGLQGLVKRLLREGKR